MYANSKKNILIIGLIIGLSMSLFAAQRPNIIVMISDDHSMDSLGAYGGEQAHTPNIDRLAKEGVMHTRAYTTASLCVPTRFSCLTGQYASRARYPLHRPMTTQANIGNSAFFASSRISDR
jgi:hypothetical protein